MGMAEPPETQTLSLVQDAMHEVSFVDLDPATYIPTQPTFDQFQPNDPVDPSMAVKIPISPSQQPHVPSNNYSLHSALDSSQQSLSIPFPTPINPVFKQEETVALAIGSNILDECVARLFLRSMLILFQNRPVCIDRGGTV